MSRRPASPGQIQRLLNLTCDPDQSWTAFAACREVSGDLFFPDKGDSNRPAKAVCQHCSVRDQCLEAALANGEAFGIFGGTSPRERMKLRSDEKRVA